MDPVSKTETPLTMKTTLPAILEDVNDQAITNRGDPTSESHF